VISVFLFLPLLGALLVSLASKPAKFPLAWLFAAATLILALALWVAGPTSVSLPWVPALGLTYSLSMGGVSTLLAVIAAFMTLLAVIYAGAKVEGGPGMLALVLAMESGLLGIFLSRDLLLFYVFFEFTLLPSLLLLARFGGQDRLRALIAFGIYTTIGSLFMLVAIIALRSASGAPTFALSAILQATAKHALSGTAQRWLFLGFLAAFAVKLPIFPLHAWMPDYHQQNHPSGVADVMGTLYKVGGYGIYRFALPLFPKAAADFQLVLMALAAFSTLYFAWIAFHQSDYKRILAYAGLSHMGLVALGLFSLNPVAITGSMFLLAFQNVYTGSLFLAVGMLWSRVGSLSPDQGGLMVDAPVLSGLTMVLWFGAIAVPGLVGFVGEFSVLLGSYQVNPWLAFIAGLSIIAAGSYALFAYQRSFWEARPEGRPKVPDLGVLEGTLLGISVVVVGLFGIYTQPALRLIQPGVLALGHLIGVA
jgi:NADH-quinone oxidoreductase subunit M